MIDFKRQVILGVLLSVGFPLISQSDFRPGLVITEAGDTLLGELDARGGHVRGHSVTFRRGGEATTYLPDNLRGYRFTDGAYYLSKAVTGQAGQFVEVLASGPVSLYSGANGSKNVYYLERGDDGLAFLPTFQEEVRQGDRQYVREAGRHKNILSYYLREVPGLERQIADLRKPDYRNLLKLAEHYYDVACPDLGLCPTYLAAQAGWEWQLQVNSIVTFLRDGATSYPNGISVPKSQPAAGLLLRFRPERGPDNLYLRLGVQYYFDDIGYAGETVPFEAGRNNFRFSAGVEYLYPKGAVRPLFTFGTVVTNSVNQFTVMSTGLYVPIGEDFAVTTEVGAEFATPALFIPRSFYGYHLLLGVAYRIR